MAVEDATGLGRGPIGNDARCVRRARADPARDRRAAQALRDATAGAREGRLCAGTMSRNAVRGTVGAGRLAVRAEVSHLRRRAGCGKQCVPRAELAWRSSGGAYEAQREAGSRQLATDFGADGWLRGILGREAHRWLRVVAPSAHERLSALASRLDGAARASMFRAEWRGLSDSRTAPAGGFIASVRVPASS